MSRPKTPNSGEPTYGVSARWKIVAGPGNSFRVEPVIQRWTVYFAVAWGLFCAVGVWFLPHVGIQERVLVSFLSPLIMAMLAGLLAWTNATEKRLGPYLVFDGDSLVLRCGTCVSLAGVRSFSIFQQWEEETPGLKEYAKITRLVATLNDGSSVELVKSALGGQVKKVEQMLNEALERARSTPGS